MSKRPLYLLLLLAILASTNLASWVSPHASPAPPPAPAAVSPLSPAPGGETILMPPAGTPLCSGFFFVDCSRQCTDGSQQSAFGSGCTCDAARSNCTSKLTCTGATTIGPCDS
jgi:hypothetical protein